MDRLEPLALHHGAARLHRTGTIHLGAEPDVEPLLAELHQRLRSDVGIDPGEDPIGVFEDRHLGAEAAPNAAELEADVAAADHDQMPGDGVVRKRLGACPHDAAVDLDARQHDARAPHREDDPGGLEKRLRAVGPGHFDAPRPGEPAGAADPGDLVLRQQAVDPLAERGDDLFLALEHRGQIEGHRADLDAVMSKLTSGFLVFVARLEERLGRDAPDPQAGAAEAVLLLDHSGGEPELGGTDGGHIAAGTGTDHQHVIRLHRPAHSSHSPAIGRGPSPTIRHGIPSTGRAGR